MRVHCNCWKEGRLKPWPHPFHIHFDPANGLWLPDYAGITDSEAMRRNQLVYQWLQSCCEHPNMVLVQYDLVGRFNLDDFQFALAKIGWQHFPTLYAELPPANDQFTPAEAARQITDELFVFQRLAAAYSKDPIRRIRLENYAEIIEALFAVCYASSSSDNPIYW